MKVLINFFRVLFDLASGHSKGYCVKQFCVRSGITYIKLGQILAMQNYDNLFDDKDKKDLLTITDDCKHISYKRVLHSLIDEYGDLSKYFKRVYKCPVGSASVSQVHKAVLLNGDVVAIKVKRKDVEERVHKDIKTIKICMRLFGRLFGFYNFIGGKTALTYLEDWILAELDFRHEVSNIQRYTEFAETVNGKVDGCHNIVLPRVYTELCTDNVIVMEFVPYRTLSKGETANHVLPAMDTYVRLSFYALFHNLPVIWHGDPHAGNIYIDDDGNVGFLDMGLIFELTPNEADLCLQLFLAVYLQRKEKLFSIISQWLDNASSRADFYNELDIYVRNIPYKHVTNYFMDLVFVCARVHINPPRWLYNMAKAFVCLNGIDEMYFNETTGHDLLLEQVIEYLVMEGTNTTRSLSKDCIELISGALVHDRAKVVMAISRGVADTGRLMRLV